MIKHLIQALLLLTIFCLPGRSQQIDSTNQIALYELFHRADTFEQDRPDQLYEAVLPEAQRKRQDFWKSILETLATIPKEDLGLDDQINYDVFRYVVQDRYDRLRLRMYLIPFNAEGGFYNRLTRLPERYDFNEAKDLEAYEERLAAYPAYMRDNIVLMRIGMESGMVAPRLIAENYAVLIRPFMESNLDSNLLFQPYLNLPDSFPEREKWVTRGKSLLQDSIIPIYEFFDAFMQQSYIPACREKIGISQIPGGKELYEQRIAFFTSLDMTPEDVFQKGQEEVARIRAEMEDIIDEVGFEGSYADFLNFLRTDERFYAKTPRDLLKEASYYSKKIDGKLPRYFTRLPTLPYGVEPVPAAIAPNYTGGRYAGGSWESHRAGQYWVNTYKLESRPLYVLPALTLHEAVPGHHLQIALSQELEDLPNFRNKTYISAFGEGWALYCEWLGKEMDIYESSFEQFGRLTYEMWRACRLVVDVGIHYKDWNRDQAFEFLSSNTALSLHECNTEINRYIGWPGQAVSYKIGELKIRELRKQAEAALGDKFDIRTFHDAVLENGAIPLFVLQERIEAYIKRHRSP